MGQQSDAVAANLVGFIVRAGLGQLQQLRLEVWRKISSINDFKGGTDRVRCSGAQDSTKHRSQGIWALGVVND